MQGESEGESEGKSEGESERESEREGEMRVKAKVKAKVKVNIPCVAVECAACPDLQSCWREWLLGDGGAGRMHLTRRGPRSGNGGGPAAMRQDAPALGGRARRRSSE